MPNTLQTIPCPLCLQPAKREELPLGDGFRYLCNPCGGVFEIGSVAQARADSQRLHPDVPEVVQHYLAKGDRPRIELNAGELRVILLPATAN